MIGSNASKISESDVHYVKSGDSASVTVPNGYNLLTVTTDANGDIAYWQFVCAFNNTNQFNTTFTGPMWYLIFRASSMNDHYGFKIYNKWREMVVYIGPQILHDGTDVNEILSRKGRVIVNNLALPGFTYVAEHS